MQKAEAFSPSHEDLIVQRYPWLLGWALEMTEGRREQAEDLVHEVFVHFTLDRPDLNAISQNLEGYLYAMLRNMHISGIRRAARQRDVNLSLDQLNVAEHESLEEELRATNERTLAVEDRLRRICEYACIRKQTSKAGSVLILRFFHGYYPAEIASIVGIPRGAVNELLRNARAEAKLYLTNPDSLAFMTKRREAVSFTGTKPSSDLVQELRRRIFNASSSPCLTSNQLRDLYESATAKKIDTAALSHLVSCPKCLDAANELLGVPPLANRYPTKVLGKDTRPKGKSGGGGAGDGAGGTASGGDVLSRSRRRLRRVIDHRPEQLRVAVNGFLIGSQKVGLKSNEQVISVNIEEKIGFVEIFSDKDVRMLFTTVAPPPEGPIEHRKRIDLSDGRSLELSLSFSEPWPNLRVIYRDPALQANTEGAFEPLAVGEGAEDVDDTSAPVTARHLPPLLGEDRGDVAKLSDRVVSSSAPSADAVQPKAWTEIRRSIVKAARELWRKSFDRSFWLRPGVVTAAFALLLISALLFLSFRRSPNAPITAADILKRAVASEDLIASNRDQVIHRTIQLEERKVAQTSVCDGCGELIACRKIEVWQSAEHGITARRLYDENGSLVSGDWRRSDGVQTIYHHGKRPQIQTPSTQLAVRNSEIWQADLSAKDFASIVGGAANARAEERPNAYVITSEEKSSALSPQTSAPFAVRKAVLVLNRYDLRPIEQTLVISQGNDTLEYKFSEVAFEQKPLNTVAPSVFEPDAVLLSSESPKPNILNPTPEAAVPGSQPTTPFIATTAQEIEVLQLLSGVGADLGQEVSVERSGGRLLIQGVVDTERRKSEILQALRLVSGDRAIKIDLITTAEAARRQAQSSGHSNPVEPQQMAPGESKIPAHAELERYFTARGFSGEKLNAEVLRFAERTLGRSRQMLLHAGALKRLAARFSPEDLRTLDQDSRAKWLTLIRAHAIAIQRENGLLRQDLTMVFSPPSEPEGSGVVPASDDAAIFRAAERLFDLCAQTDHSISAAFVLSSSGASVAPMRTTQFWRTLSEVDRQAAGIQRAVSGKR